MFSCLVFLDPLTMLRPLPEHLHLELVVMVMRGGDLQPQVFKGNGAQRGFGVRERGGNREVRGRRRERRDQKRRGKGGWRGRRRRGELIGEIVAFGQVWSRGRRKRRRKRTQRKTLLLCVSVDYILTMCMFCVYRPVTQHMEPILWQKYHKLVMRLQLVASGNTPWLYLA